MHHTTFKVPNIYEAKKRAEDLGYQIVGFDDSNPYWQEFFLSPKEGLGTVIQLSSKSKELGDDFVEKYHDMIGWNSSWVLETVPEIQEWASKCDMLDSAGRFRKIRLFDETTKVIDNPTTLTSISAIAGPNEDFVLPGSRMSAVKMQCFDLNKARCLWGELLQGKEEPVLSSTSNESICFKWPNTSTSLIIEKVSPSSNSSSPSFQGPTRVDFQVALPHISSIKEPIPFRFEPHPQLGINIHLSPMSTTSPFPSCQNGECPQGTSVPSMEAIGFSTAATSPFAPLPAML